MTDARNRRKGGPSLLNPAEPTSKLETGLS
jgi:hypothetical protein